MFHIQDVFDKKSERDQQKTVGASNLCNPCAKCLAENMLGIDYQSEYVMGAKIGTAIHEYIERQITQHYPTLVPERRVTIGEIPGYGFVTSTSDLYIPDEKRVCDWKTTTNSKAEKLCRDLANAEWLLENPDEAIEQGSGKALSYIIQTHLYAYGMEETYGDPVERITIGVIPRDARTLGDIRERTFPYYREVAIQAFERAKAIWAWLEEGGDPDDLAPVPGCFVCERVR